MVYWCLAPQRGDSKGVVFILALGISVYSYQTLRLELSYELYFSRPQIAMVFLGYRL